jgi:two-component system chemotaxis response regulator CheB
VTEQAASTRVLICEDSRTYAAGLRRLLEYDGDIVVAAVCTSAEEALAALPAVSPDLVTMDIELPGMNGLQAVEDIMATRPCPILVLSSHVGGASELTAATLAAGALDAIAKDDLPLLDPGTEAAAALRRRVHRLSRARVIRHPRARLRTDASVRAELRDAAAVGIVASTGGPQNLAAILRSLPAAFAVPVLVVQHMSAGFTEGLARWLDGVGPLPVRLARDGAVAESGVWIAPEDAHLLLRADMTLALDRRSEAGLHRPSGDVLLTSIAAAAGRDAVAVVLTGMGRDGAAGAKAVCAAGGSVFVQDEESSAVYGMPKAAAADSGCAISLAPADIAAHLVALRPSSLVGRR